MKRIFGWRSPPNWSQADWREEVRCLAEEVAWQAVCSYDPSRGTPLRAFVRSRVLAAALAHYRREWAYAFHTAWRSRSSARVRSAIEPGRSPGGDELYYALARLTDTDRWVLEQVCLLGRTEEDVGRELGVSHQAVSLRKKRAIASLRAALAGR